MLTVALVMERYHLRDRRTARRLMDEAGSFRLGANLYVRLRDLVALEDARRVARGSAPGTGRNRAAGAAEPARPLRPGWWRPGSREEPPSR